MKGFSVIFDEGVEMILYEKLPQDGNITGTDCVNGSLVSHRFKDVIFEMMINISIFMLFFFSFVRH